jgi:hypothetical protein
MQKAFKERERAYIKTLSELLSVPKSRQQLYHAIVDAPFHDPLSATYLDLGIIVLLLVSEDGKTIDRIALSNTVQAAEATRTSEKPFHDIKIPARYEKNIIAKAISTGKMQQTEDWKDLFVPALTPESARFNQATAGIARSLVFPIKVQPKGGAMIFSLFEIPESMADLDKFIRTYTQLVSKALSKV